MSHLFEPLTEAVRDELSAFIRERPYTTLVKERAVSVVWRPVVCIKPRFMYRPNEIVLLFEHGFDSLTVRCNPFAWNVEITLGRSNVYSFKDLKWDDCRLHVEDFFRYLAQNFELRQDLANIDKPE